MRDQAELARDLIESWQAPLYNYACRWLRDATEAEDATQEIFIELLRGYHQLRSPEAVKAWVYRIAGRVLYRHQRRRDRELPRASAVGLAEVSSASQVRSVEDKERRALVEASVSALPERLRAAMVLRYFQGLTQHEVAEALELPRSTVQSRIKKGLELLRSQPRLAGAAMAAPELEALLALVPSRSVPSSLSSSLSALSLEASSPVGALAGGVLVSTKLKAAAVALTLALVAWVSLGTLLPIEDRQREAQEAALESPTSLESSASGPVGEARPSSERGTGSGRAGEASRRAAGAPSAEIEESRAGADLKAASVLASRTRATAASSARARFEQAGRGEVPSTAADVVFELSRPSGEPYPGLKVFKVTTPGEARERPYSLRLQADEKGVVSMRFSETGRYRFRVSGVTSEEATVAVDLKRGRAERVSLVLEPARGLWVTVLDQATRDPIEGAGVSFSENDSHGATAYGQTDALGRTYIKAEKAGTYLLMVSKSAYLGFSRDPRGSPRTQERLVLTEGQMDAGMTLYLTKGCSLAVSVVDAAGQPLEAEVSLLSSRGFDKARERTRSGFIRFTNQAPGRIRVLAKSAEYLSASREMTLTLGEPERQLELTLQRGLTLSGRVVGPEGAGIAGARVEAMPASREGPFLKPVGRDRHAGRRRATRADAGGRFEIKGLKAGVLDLIVSAPGFEAAVRRSLSFGANFDEELEFRLKPGGTITVRVLDRQGRAVKDCSVFIKRGSFREEMVGQTGADGRFKIEGLLPVGHYLQFFSREHSVHWVDGVVPGGEPLSVSLAPRLEIRGKVTPAGGGPVVRRLTCYFRDGNYGDATLVEVEEDGRFRMALRSVRASSFTFSAEGYLPIKIESPKITEGEVFEAELAFQLGASVEGVVVDGRGRARANTPILFQDSRGNRMVARTNEVGRFGFDHLPAGKFLLVAKLERDGAAKYQRLEVELFAGQSRKDLEITLRD